jgi:site-specific DNA recombinase
VAGRARRQQATRRGRQDHSCDLPHLPVQEVEDAVLSHYATVGLAPSISEEVRTMIHQVRQEQYDASAGLRDRIRLEIARLEKQEDRAQ